MPSPEYSKLIRKVLAKNTSETTLDPLGPVSFSEAQALRPHDPPDLHLPWKHQFVAWEVHAYTEEARALLDILASSLGIHPDEQPGKRGPKPKMTEAQVLEAFVGSLLRNAQTGHWSAQAMTTAAFADLPVGATTFRRVLKRMEKARLVQVTPGFKRRKGLGDSAITKFRPSEALLRKAETHGVSWRDAERHFTTQDTLDNQGGQC